MEKYSDALRRLANDLDMNWDKMVASGKFAEIVSDLLGISIALFRIYKDKVRDE